MLLYKSNQALTTKTKIQVSKEVQITYLNDEEVRDLVYGAAFLGSGGGGSFEIGKLFGEALIKLEKKPALVNVDALADHRVGSVVAGIGSPKELQDTKSLMIAIDNAVKRMSTVINKKYDFAIVVESGLNMLVTLMYAAEYGLYVPNGDGVGRAVPELAMTSFAQANIPISPVVIASRGENPTVSVLYAKQAGEIEQLARPILGTPLYDNLGGLALWTTTALKLKQEDSFFKETFTTAINIGRAIRSGIQDNTAIEKLLEELGEDAQLLAFGKITAIEETTKGGFDFGKVIFKTSDEIYTIYVLNENLLMTDSKNRPVAMAPDLISYLTPNGIPITNGDNLSDYINKDMAIIGVKAKHLRNSYFIDAFMAIFKLFDYNGNYIAL